MKVRRVHMQIVCGQPHALLEERLHDEVLNILYSLALFVI